MMKADKDYSKHKRFLDIEYGELTPEIKNNVILDEPLKCPAAVTPEWREWITSQQTKNLNKLHEKDPIENLKIENTRIQYDDEDVAVRIYTPLGEGPFPVMVYIHGGGWVFCDLETHDHDCRYLCVNSQNIIISVDYLLAPEGKFPKQIKESMAVIGWVLEKANEINGLTSGVAVGGDSAGGNITAGLCLYNRDNQGYNITKQILIYPAADLSNSTYYSYTRYGAKEGMGEDAMGFADFYVNNRDELFNIYVSPMLCDDLSGLPPALFLLGECDILVDDGLVYAQRLKEAGVSVKCNVYKGMPHGFIQALYKEAYEALDEICSELKK